VRLEDERSCTREPLGGGLDKPPVELEVVAAPMSSRVRWRSHVRWLAHTLAHEQESPCK
jgi:hypothetical protein